jgi:ArsR family transcriptional regulator
MEKFDVIKLLSDKTRYNILTKLLDFDQLCVCEIEQLLGLKQANTSKHLKRFKELNVVETNRDGNVVYYKLSETFLREHEDLIKYIIM